MEYKLEDGDFLEREFADQIRQYLPFYEKVWSLYIGHKGSGLIAELPGYDDNEKRTDFAENSYTVLQSALVIHSIINSGTLSLPHNDINNIIEFHKNLVAFYALIGRINDCLNKAAERIGIPSLKAELKSFYDQRNVILHYRTLPLKIDDLGMPEMPDIRTWRDHGIKWSNSKYLAHENAEDTTKEIFEELMIKVNNEYARMYEILSNEMKQLGLKLEVVQRQHFDAATSGTTQPYGILTSNSSNTSQNNFEIFGAEAYLNPKVFKKG